MRVLKYYEYISESTKSVSNILKLRDMIISDISEEFIESKKIPHIFLKDYKNYFDDSSFIDFLSKEHKIILEEKESGLASYDTYNTKNVFLYYPKKLMNQLLDCVNYKIFDEIPNLFKNYFASDLAHELQHAYDDYLSKYKIFNNKKNINYINNQKRLNDISNTLTDYGYDLEQHKIRNQYFNLQQEIDARFTQFVDEYDFMENGKKKPFEKVLNDFKYNNDVIKHNKLLKTRLPKLYKKLYDFWQNFKKETI